jgi:putative peptidoglycan lipid II flippase
MLYHTLKKRGHFEADHRLRSRVPRLAIAAIAMGAALYWIAPVITPYLTGSIVRRVLGLTALVGSGGIVYAIACLVTGAFVVDDLKLMMRRTRQA